MMYIRYAFRHLKEDLSKVPLRSPPVTNEQFSENWKIYNFWAHVDT